MKSTALIVCIAAACPVPPAAAETAAVPQGMVRVTSQSIPTPTVQLTADEIESFRKRVFACWSPPKPQSGERRFVLVTLRLRQDGSLETPPKVIQARAASAAQAQSDATQAVAALTACAPFSGLPPAKYELWREVDVHFEADRPPPAR